MDKGSRSRDSQWTHPLLGPLLFRLGHPTNRIEEHLWREAADKLREQLPPDLLALMKSHEADGTINSEEYQKAVQVYYDRHMCRVKPYPKDFMDSLQGLKEDPTVHTTM